MQNDITQIAGNESISRTFWRYAIPSIAAMVVNGLYQVVDGMFVGHYVGFEGLAGITLAWPIIGLIAGLGIMVGMGGGSLVSIFRGEAKPQKAKLALSTSLWLVALCGLLAMIFIITLGDDIIAMQGASGNSKIYSLEYIQVFAWGTLFTIGGAAIPMLIRNDNSPNVATSLMTIGAIINIGLDYLLIGQFGLRLEGAAIATLISQFIVALLGFGYFFSKHAEIKLDLRQFAFNPTIAGRSIALGSSSLFMFLYFSFIAAIHNKLFMTYGDAVQVGAFAIVGYLATMYYLASEGIANGMQPPVSYYFGAKQVERIRATVWLALKVILISGIATVAIVNLYPEALIGMFSNGDQALLDATKNGLRLHLFALFLDGFIFLASVYFMSVNQGGKALAISIGNMVIQLPFLYVLPKIMGLNGIWMSVPISNIVLTLIIVPFLWRDLKNISNQNDGQSVGKEASVKEERPTKLQTNT
ncbi:MATE family efflux transporter [Vibrio tapetis]|uniref:Multidrug export protein MepA n=1 Tax=Vibrio tapetis subsp. tapetis TaxID=1671868 RepID=A0A2N8ZJ67_9VIBR|nr:MATE family efflux transporter [Vibrio tapetis]SON51939.1 putative Na+-driven multidrug efflux pump [Vibrio tapetis subsp. tapetis]